MKTTRLSIDNSCPACESILNAATSLNHDSPPAPGDLTVCCYCGTPLQFKEDMTFQICPQEILDLPDIPKDFLKAISYFKGRRH